MRIGILSDTHDKRKRTARAIERLRAEGVEALIHCGDLTGPEIVYECATIAVPCYFVFGNNDYEAEKLRRSMQEVNAHCLEYAGEFVLAGKRIAVTHGDSGPLMRKFLLAEPDYLFTGHTHFPADSREGRTRWINPGALHRADMWTVAVLDLTTDDLHLLTIEDTR